MILMGMRLVVVIISISIQCSYVLMLTELGFIEAYVTKKLM